LVGDPIELARSLSPLLAEHDFEIDDASRVPDSVMTAIMDTGLPWMMMPKRVGGAGVTMRTHIEAVAELGRGSAGAAWQVGLLMNTTAAAASLPEPAVERIFRTGRELVCGVTMPIGTARPTADGYIVNGRWPYASGSQYADWGMGGVRVLDDGGNPTAVGFAFMPIGAGGLSIDNTWNVTGMRGSASDTIVAQDLFVPWQLVPHDDPEWIARMPQFDLEPRDQWPTAVFLGLALLAPLLGAARNLLERTIGNVDKKPITHWDYLRQADSHVVLEQIGEAAMEIDTAWLHVLRAADALDITAQSGPVCRSDQVRLQAAEGFAMKMIRQAAERLMDIGGASAFAMSNPLQRAWRDIALGSRHAFVNTSQSLELYGRDLAGESLQSTLFRNVAGQD
jgi:alkylation response protein AidB-like acyl-CoA dehydrogenase